MFAYTKRSDLLDVPTTGDVRLRLLRAMQAAGSSNCEEFLATCEDDEIHDVATAMGVM